MQRLQFNLTDRTPGGVAIKTDRHTTIRALLASTPISNQDELRRQLAEHGLHATQATLSRDIRELKLVKGPAGYALPSAGAPIGDNALPATAELLQSFGLAVQQAQNLLVLHTVGGAAPPVAAGIDEERWPEVVGTVAGDNTVLIICPDPAHAHALSERLEALLV